MFVGGGPCSNDISSISQKVCDILGEDSPTISGIEGGLDIDEIDHISVSNENKRRYESLPDSEDEEDIPPVSKRQRYALDFGGDMNITFMRIYFYLTTLKYEPTLDV